jgi:hypothetical protein
MLSPNFASSFSQNFSNGYRNAVRKNPRNAQFWKHIKTMTVEGDKLVISTQPTQ